MRAGIVCRLIRIAGVATLTTVPGLCETGEQIFEQWRNLILTATDLDRSGHFREEESTLKTAAGLAEGMSGPDAAKAAAVTLNAFALLYSETNRLYQAERAGQEALRRLEILHEPDNELLASALSNLLTIYVENGRIEKAEREAARFASLDFSKLTPVELLRVHTVRGRIFQFRARYRDAESEYRLAISDAGKIGDKLDVAGALNNLGSVEIDDGSYAAAAAHIREAIQITESVVGRDSPRLIHPLMNLGTVAYAENQYEESRSSIERALTIAERVHGPTSPTVARVLETYAAVLQRAGDKKFAKTVRARARTIADASGPDAYGRYTIDVKSLRERGQPR